jgi:pimeloyl-ACP methyl ester carboxylesterase
MRRLVGLMRTIAKWTAIGVVGLIVLLLLFANLYGMVGRHRLARDLDPPGRLVDVGTHRMHIFCVGEGLPTVVLDAGGGSFFIDFAAVLEQARQTTQVCAFDRSGMGWSEDGPDAPGPETRLRDLEALLASSGEPGPYVFGGHSLGGAYAWLYAQRHRDQAVGLIVVDAPPRDARRLQELRPGPAGPGQGALFRAVEMLGLVPVLMAGLEASHPEPERYSQFPEWAMEVVERRAFLSGGAITELRMGPANSQAGQEMSDLGDLPLVVIAQDEPGFFFDAYAENRDEAARVWRMLQEEMATLSSDAEFVVAESSDHQIPFHRPDVIVDAIRRLTTRYRGGLEP